MTNIKTILVPVAVVALGIGAFSVIYGRTRGEEVPPSVPQDTAQQATEPQPSVLNTDNGVENGNTNSVTPPTDAKIVAEQNVSAVTPSDKQQTGTPLPEKKPTTIKQPVPAPAPAVQPEEILAIPDEFSGTEFDITRIQLGIGRILNERQVAGDSDPVPELLAWISPQPEVASATYDAARKVIQIRYTNGKIEDVKI